MFAAEATPIGFDNGAKLIYEIRCHSFDKLNVTLCFVSEEQDRHISCSYDDS